MTTPARRPAAWAGGSRARCHTARRQLRFSDRTRQVDDGCVARASPPTPSPPTLVVRDRERGAPGETLDAVLAGRESPVLIGGEAGIGKTTLAEGLLAEAGEQGPLVLVGRCYDLAETPALDGKLRRACF